MRKISDVDDLKKRIKDSISNLNSELSTVLRQKNPNYTSKFMNEYNTIKRKIDNSLYPASLKSISTHQLEEIRLKAKRWHILK